VRMLPDVFGSRAVVGVSGNGSRSVCLGSDRSSNAVMDSVLSAPNAAKGVTIHSFSILSDDRFKASSKTIPPHSAI
jgi:hypothetical protein